MPDPFREAVERSGGRSAVAKRLGCTVEFVRLLEKRARTPSLPMALKIQKELGVSVTSWQGIARG